MILLGAVINPIIWQYTPTRLRKLELWTGGVNRHRLSAQTCRTIPHHAMASAHLLLSALPLTGCLLSSPSSPCPHCPHCVPCPPGLTASQPTQGNSLVLNFCSTVDDTFVTGGDYTLRVWKVNRKRRFITPTNVSISEVKRKIRCLKVREAGMRGTGDWVGSSGSGDGRGLD